MNQSTFNTRVAQLLKLPAWLAGISFGLGTSILLLHIYGDRDISYAIGFLYLVFISFVNASVFGALAICSFLFKEYQKAFLQQAAVLLINIPVVILYIYIVLNNQFLETNQYQALKQSNQKQLWKHTKIS